MEDFREKTPEVNAPLDYRFVVLGVVVMLVSAVIMVFNENVWIRHVGITGFVSSFFVMSRKKRGK